MCGINGFYSTARAMPANSKQLVSAMNDRVSHRGPDDAGVWSSDDGSTIFGHRRLSILDLSPAGHQPMSTSGGTTIVFNGEIYNFKELRSLVSDYPFKSSSDTETILALYEKFGEDCLKHLNGMFAFAIFDPKDNSVFLARDRVGKKPLYYIKTPDQFSFASEIKSLLVLPWVAAELDDMALYDFLTFNFVPSPRTMFKDIFKLEPGYCMRINRNGQVDTRQYWDVEFQQVAASEEEITDQLYEKIVKAVDYRMISDVPVGAFLSGGVDSSAMVALMSKRVSYPVKTYSIGFENQPDYDELEYAKHVSDKFNTDHYTKIVTRKDIVDFLPKVVDFFDEPMADPTCIPIYFLSQLAKEHDTKVVINGDGPDELLLGYRNWMRYQRIHPFYRAFAAMPRFAKSPVAKLLQGAMGDSPSMEIIRRAVDREELFCGGARSFKETTKRSFLTDDYLSRVGEASTFETIGKFRRQFDSTQNGLSKSYGNWMSYLGFKFLIPNFFMYRADRLGMAHSVEARCPLLDYEFVNYALSIEARWKTKGKEPKYVLKKSLERILPNDVLYRKKQGFCVPIREWGGDVMTDFIEKNLDHFCDRVGAFRPDALRRQLARFKTGQVGQANDLWTIYFLMAWVRKWL